MANHLSVAKVHSILTLHGRGWSQRRIARELGVDRETVARHVRLAASTDSNPATSANAPPGSVAAERANPASGGNALTGSGRVDEMTAPTASVAGGAAPGSPGSAPGRHDGPTASSGPASGCEPYRDLILSKLAQGLSAVRIHQDLLEVHGGRDEEADDEPVPSYHSVRRYVKRLRQASPDPFRRIEKPPGQEAQVDFGTGAPIVTGDGSGGGSGGGKRRRTHVLRVVLSHSRAGYSEVVERQTTDAFIRCIENAFHHFGGAPQTLVLDNLRAAVSKADWFDPELTPKVQSFLAHYGVVALPSRPYTPRHKDHASRCTSWVGFGRTLAA